MGLIYMKNILVLINEFDFFEAPATHNRDYRAMNSLVLLPSPKASLK